MTSLECGEDTQLAGLAGLAGLVGLVGLAPELVHKVALSGWLRVGDVCALSQTCRRMADILVWDEYGKDVHMALLGVMENVETKRWKSARYAVGRKWFVEGEGEDEESVWKDVAEALVGDEKIVLENDEDLAGWENVMLAALSLPGASGCLDRWKHLVHGYEDIASLLHLGVYAGSERVVDWVVERGGELEESNLFGRTPLLLAARNGRLGVVRKLVESGANVTARDKYARNVLHAASQSGNVQVVRFVYGLRVANVEQKDRSGRSPLSVACEAGHVDVVKVMVEEVGADVDVEGKDSHGPLFWACGGGNMEVVGMLVELGSGSGVGKDGGVWVSGLVKAAEKGQVETVRALIGMGVGVDEVDENGGTALCSASWNGYVDVVDVLMSEGGADVNAAGERGETPLISACHQGREDVVRILLDAGADVERFRDGGETALDVARRMGRDSVVGMLEPRYRPPGAERSGAELGGSVLVVGGSG